MEKSKGQGKLIPVTGDGFIPEKPIERSFLIRSETENDSVKKGEPILKNDELLSND